jgi:GNAT superfamily N-acetyltransferase
MSPVASIEQNLVEFFRHFARVRRTGRIAELDGVSIASSGIEFHMFNAAFFSTPLAGTDEELDRRVGLAADSLGAEGARWAFWACMDKLGVGFQNRASRVFRRWELFPAFRHPGMVCDGLLPARRPAAALEFRKVEDAGGRAEFARLNSHAFRVPFEWCLDLYDIEALWTPAFTGYIGYAGSRAVCSAATLIAAEAIGVYSVSTLPGHERKGYGETVTRHAVTSAQRETGLNRTILQATVSGLPLYRRMGYELATHFVIYSH